MKNTRYKKIIPSRLLPSGGFTLIELMVGITVGLMVVMVAVYAIITARKASGTVTDVSTMKQQASYVMYVVGTQIRQTGSMDAIQDSDLTAMPEFYFSQAFQGFTGGTPTNPIALQGGEGVGPAGSDTLGIAIRPTPVLVASQTDCLGNTFPASPVPGDTAAYNDATIIPDVLMTFEQNANSELICRVENRLGGGVPVVVQSAALAQNVTGFQVTYRYRQRNAGGDTTFVADANPLGIPGAAGNFWDNVDAVEICIEMQGTEPVPVVAGATYTNCQNVATSQGNRLTRVYRSLYNLKVNVHV